jgi:hypothetical protein
VSAYDIAVIADDPAAYYRLDGADAEGHAEDAFAGAGAPRGYWSGGRTRTMLPNGDWGAAFNGIDGRFEVESFAGSSAATTGALTVEAWIRPDSLIVPVPVGSGYCHWLSKTAPGFNEWAMRYYSRLNSETPPRPNAISGYAYNPAGGLGAGSRFQDPIVPGQWIHVALVIDATDVDEDVHPMGVTRIYRDGVLRDADSLEVYNVVPTRGPAPVRIGWRFPGAVAKVAFYDRAVPAERLVAHRDAMVAS